MSPTAWRVCMLELNSDVIILGSPTAKEVTIIAAANAPKYAATEGHGRK